MTLGVQLIIIPWSSINKKYQDKLGEKYNGDKVDMAFIDCEGTNYKNNEYAQLLYLFSWLISSVTHINVSKVIDDLCENAIKMTCLHARKANLQNVFSSHIWFLIRDVTKKSYPEASKLSPIIEKRPDLLNSLKEFKNGYKLMPIYPPNTSDAGYDTTEKSESFYNSVIASLECTLDQLPSLLDKQPWLNEIKFGVSLFEGKEMYSKSLDELIIMTMKMKTKTKTEKTKKTKTKTEKTEKTKKTKMNFCSNMKKGIIAALNQENLDNTCSMIKKCEEEANEEALINKLSPSEQEAIKQLFEKLSVYYNAAAVQCKVAREYIDNLDRIYKDLESKKEELMMYRKGYKTASIASSIVGIGGAALITMFPVFGLVAVGVSIVGGITGSIGIGVYDSKIESNLENKKEEQKRANDTAKSKLNIEELNSKAIIAIDSINKINFQEIISQTPIVPQEVLSALGTTANLLGNASLAAKKMITTPAVTRNAAKFFETSMKNVKILSNTLAAIGVVLSSIMIIYDVATFSSCQQSIDVDKVLKEIKEARENMIKCVLKHPKRFKKAYLSQLEENLNSVVGITGK